MKFGCHKDATILIKQLIHTFPHLTQEAEELLTWYTASRYGVTVDLARVLANLFDVMPLGNVTPIINRMWRDISFQVFGCDGEGTIRIPGTVNDHENRR